MKLKFRINSTNERHMVFTVFQDHGNCGALTMDTAAALQLFKILERAAKDSEHCIEKFDFTTTNS